MRKIIGIIVLLFVHLRVIAVSFEPVTYSALPTEFRSTSAYNGSIQTGGSLSAISASNFATLNTEGGACYNPAASSGPRRGRPQENDYGGTGAIGNLDYHSPVGDTPWPLFALLLGAYIAFKKIKNRPVLR